jgi:hypothetical protein
MNQRDLYIYYRAAVMDAPKVLAAVKSLQRDLRRNYGVQCGLKQRPEATDELHTWMEIYLNAPIEFEAALSIALSGSSLSILIVGKRHTEYFLDCLPCV